MTQAERADVLEFCNRPNAAFDVLVASMKTSVVGFNVQAAIHHVVFMEVPDSLADYIQGIGRVHRLNQLSEQTIWILEMDSSYDGYRHARLSYKCASELVAQIGMEVPSEVQAEGDDAADAYMRRETDRFVQTLLGQTTSRIPCGNMQEPISFKQYPPGSTLPQKIADAIAGKF